MDEIKGIVLRSVVKIVCKSKEILTLRSRGMSSLKKAMWNSTAKLLKKVN